MNGNATDYTNFPVFVLHLPEALCTSTSHVFQALLALSVPALLANRVFPWPSDMQTDKLWEWVGARYPAGLK